MIDSIEQEKKKLTETLREIAQWEREQLPVYEIIKAEEKQLIDLTYKHNYDLEQYNKLKHLDFDAKRYEMILQVIEKYNDIYNSRTIFLLKIAQKEKEEAELLKELSTLAKYDGETSIDDEMRVSLINLNTHKNNTAAFVALDKQISNLNFKLEDVAQRIQTAETVKIKNEKRKYYIEKLQGIYQVLHTSEFPRKLILSYADVVTEYLDEYLELFNIPFRSKVNENFRIDMVDREGRTMPKVSGGQEVIVGLSLHLALHDLFSQSFPLMIIDEGTTHLDKENRKAYFDVVKKLKDTSKLKQMIIIDHDEDLTSVVDSVIQL